MEIKQARLITSMGNLSQFKDYNAPEIVIAGKSNVGKSSFINFLVNNKNLAKTSSTPGRTRLINYFEINKGEFMLVDLPGYGYAKYKGEDRENWDSLIGGYLQNSKNIKAVILLVDIRHDPTELDLQMLAYLHHFQIPFFIVATKADKLSKAQINKQKMVISSCLKQGVDNVIITSSLKKEGKIEVLSKIEEMLKK